MFKELFKSFKWLNIVFSVRSCVYSLNGQASDYLLEVECIKTSIGTVKVQKSGYFELKSFQCMGMER